jgi:putative transposase
VFSLSLRDVELILAERGVLVTHESIRRWGLKFGAEFAGRLQRRRPRPGDTWHLEEVFIRTRGVQHYLWRAVDQHGVVLDILVQERRKPPPSGSSSICWVGLAINTRLKVMSE